jgi:hypothetical protein
MIMNLRLSVAAIAALVALGGAAEADIFASAPGDGGAAQETGTVHCRIFNGGSNAVSISSREIWTSSSGGFRFPAYGDTCQAPLRPQNSCLYYGKYTRRGAAYASRAITGGAEENISGTMEI